MMDLAGIPESMRARHYPWQKKGGKWKKKVFDSRKKSGKIGKKLVTNQKTTYINPKNAKFWRENESSIHNL